MHFEIKLEPRNPQHGPGSPPEELPYPPEMYSVHQRVCASLERQRAGTLCISACGLDWPGVDLHTELCILLEELPRLLEECTQKPVIVLELFEQGVERRLELRSTSDDPASLRVSCHALVSGEPLGTASYVGRRELEAQLRALARTYVDLATRFASDVLSPEFDAWRRAVGE